MSKVSGLGYIGINATDTGAWRRFLTDYFGMQLASRSDGVLEARMDDWHRRFAIYPSDSDGAAYYGWEVPDFGSLDALQAKLEQHGVPVSAATPAELAERKVLRMIHFTDPHMGFRVELFVGPTVEQDAFQPSRGIAGYNTGELGLGHIVVVAKEYEKATQFYCDVLGFKISDYIIWEDKNAAFLHCNPRHHSIAIMNEFGPFSSGDLNHIMVEAKSIDDVGRAWDMVQDKGEPIILTMGRHTNDHTQSFYVATPSGFGMEYGHGGRHVHEDWPIGLYDAPQFWGHRPPAS